MVAEVTDHVLLHFFHLLDYVLGLFAVGVFELQDFFLDLFRVHFHVVEHLLHHHVFLFDFSDSVRHHFVLVVYLLLQFLPIGVYSVYFLVDFFENIKFLTSIEYHMLELSDTLIMLCGLFLHDINDISGCNLTVDHRIHQFLNHMTDFSVYIKPKQLERWVGLGQSLETFNFQFFLLRFFFL